MTALRGGVAVAFGLVVLLLPDLDDRSLALVFAAFAIADGLVLAGVAIVASDVLEQWWLLLAEGVVGVAVGAVAALFPDLSGLGLLSLLAVWAVITGVVEIEAAVRLRRLAAGERSLFIAGGLSLLAGVALVAVPVDEPVDIAWAIGVFGLVYGGVLVAVAVRLRRLARATRRRLGG